MWVTLIPLKLKIKYSQNKISIFSSLDFKIIVISKISYSFTFFNRLITDKKSSCIVYTLHTNPFYFLHNNIKCSKDCLYVVFLFHHFMCRTVFSKFLNKRQELTYIQVKKLPIWQLSNFCCPISDLMIFKFWLIIVFLTNFRWLFSSAVFAQDKYLRREMISTDISRNMSQ